MKLSVFYDHILQAAEQTGRAIPDLMNEVSRAAFLRSIDKTEKIV